MADEREDKFDVMSKAETDSIPTTRDCASNGGRDQTDPDDSLCEKCASTWTSEAIERGLALISDPISRAFFHDRPDLVEYLIRNVLGDDSIEIVEMRQQAVVTNPSGHSAQFDIFARDSTGKIYNIEFQNRNEKALIQRAFFYASTLFLNEFKAGVEYEDSPKVCVIFLVENGKGCSNKLIKRIAPNPDDVGDDWPAEIVIVNGSLHDESKVGIIMQDLRCRDLRNLRDPIFKARIYELLHQKIGRKAMCEAQIKWENELIDRGLNEGLERGRKEGRDEGLEEGRKEGRDEGLKEGRNEGLKEGRTTEKLAIARLMLDQNLADSIISYTTGLPLERINAIRAEMQMHP